MRFRLQQDDVVYEMRNDLMQNRRRSLAIDAPNWTARIHRCIVIGTSSKAPPPPHTFRNHQWDVRRISRERNLMPLLVISFVQRRFCLARERENQSGSAPRRVHESDFHSSFCHCQTAHIIQWESACSSEVYRQLIHSDWLWIECTCNECGGTDGWGSCNFMI